MSFYRKNKIGLILDEYRCKKRNYLNTTNFVKNKRPIRCNRCHTPLSKTPQGETPLNP